MIDPVIIQKTITQVYQPHMKTHLALYRSGWGNGCTWTGHLLSHVSIFRMWQIVPMIPVYRKHYMLSKYDFYNALKTCNIIKCIFLIIYSTFWQLCVEYDILLSENAFEMDKWVNIDTYIAIQWRLWCSMFQELEADNINVARSKSLYLPQCIPKKYWVLLTLGKVRVDPYHSGLLH